MRTFKRCLSAFIAVAMIFTTLMTLGVAEDSEGYSPEASETEDIIEYADTETDESSVTDIIDVDTEENSSETNSETGAEAETGTDADAETGADAETDGETEAVVSVPPDENVAVYDNSISGTLWLDMFEDVGNGIYGGDGIRQPSEESLEGYDVSLYGTDDLSGALLTVKTDSRGEYIFTGLESGGYIVGISSGIFEGVEYLLPFAGVSGDNRFHAPDETTDYKTAFSGTVNVETDTHAAGIDAGMRTPPIAQIMDVGSNIVCHIDSVLDNGDGTYSQGDGSTPPKEFTSLQDAIDFCYQNGSIYNPICIDVPYIKLQDAISVNTGRLKLDTTDIGSATIESAPGKRHFVVLSQDYPSTTLEFIGDDFTLDGGGNGGGIETSGTLMIQTDYSDDNQYSPGKLTIKNCNNPVGGGIYGTGDESSSLRIGDGIEIIENSSDSSGGGVYWPGSVTIMGAAVSRNSAGSDSVGEAYGGGIYCNQIDYNYGKNGVEITGNTVTAKYKAYGGGIYSADEDTGIWFDVYYYAKITDNKAISAGEAIGGAIYAKSSIHMNLDAYSGGNFVQITGNIADAGSGNALGGAIYSEGNSSFDFNEGNYFKISNNVAKSSSGNAYGGGIYSCGLNLEAVEISGNSADTDGGGIYCAVGDNSYINLNDDGANPTKILNNRAVNGNGGGVYTEDTSYNNLTVSPNTCFYGNTAVVAYAYSGGFGAIQAAQTSSGTSPLNNYDISYTGGLQIDGSGKPVKSISVKTQPLLTYITGDNLDLSALVVTVTYTDDTAVDIPYASLTRTIYSISGESVTNGVTVLTYAAHDQKTVAITYYGQTANTGALAVAKLTGTPTITGTAQIDQTLTVGAGTLNTTTGLTYQWKSNGQSISGATGTTYIVRGSDAGKAITVTVTAAGGYSGSATSAATAVVPYTIKLAKSGNTVAGDDVYFGTSGTMTAYAAASGTVTINYTLNRGDIVNKIEFGNGIPDVTASSGTGFVTGTVTYTVNPSNASNGAITITPRFTHQDTISNENVNITAPANGKTPDNTVASTPYNTGTVTWKPNDSEFRGSTSYTATVTLMATGDASFSSGFTPTVNGNPATSVTVSADGKTAVFTYAFPATLAKAVKSISVKTQPQLVYTSGDKLDLSSLVVTVTYDDDTTADIPYASLTGATYSINGVSVTSGKTFLTNVTHNNQMVKISYGGIPADIGTLKVHTSPAVNTSVTDVSYTSATIKYAVTNDSDDMTSKLQVFDGNAWSDVPNASSPYTVTGLTQNTTCQYRVYVYDSGTKMEYTFPVTFKTLVQDSSGWNVSGSVTGKSGQNVVVTIGRGKIVIASDTVMEDQNNSGTYGFSFENIPDGYYNLVSNNGTHKVTKTIKVTGKHVDDIELDMDDYKTQSIVEIVGEDQLLPVEAEGLEKMFKDPKFYTADEENLVETKGWELEFKLVAEKKDESDIPSDAAKIERLASGKEIGLYLDLSVVKSLYDMGGTLHARTSLTDLGDNFIDIYYYLPNDMLGKGNLTVYRVHNGNAEALPSSPNTNSRGEYAIFSGDMIMLHVCEFSTYAIAYNTNTSSSSSSGGSKSSSATPDVSTYWIEVPEAKTMAKDALGKQLDYASSSRAAITGIRKNSLLVLAESGLRYRHDTLSNGTVQVRVHIDDPSKATKDILVSGYVNGGSVDNVKAKFEKKFQNKLAVISMDQQGDFGIKVQIAAKVNLSGMNTKNLYFYSYDKNTNKYVRIETEYRIDENGYLHFATMLGGYIIVSDGPLAKHGAEQASGLSGTSTHDLHNPSTGGDSSSETWIAGNLSPLMIGNDNPETGGYSPVEILITGNSLPLTIENYSPGNGSEQEIMLSAFISRPEFSALNRGSYVNMKMAMISVLLLLAAILVGVDIPRWWKFRQYNGRRKSGF